MTGYQYLLEIEALDGSSNAVTMRYCCAPGYTGGGYDWAPRLVDPGLVQVDLFSGGKVTGNSISSFGEVVLSNQKNSDDLDGPSDAVRDYQFYGRPVRMYYGPPAGSFPADFTRAYTAIVESVGDIGSGDTVSLTLRGRQSELDTALNTAKFLGNNVAPDGLEGDSALTDQLKPVLLGRALNFSPTLCNAQKLIYAVSPVTGLAVDEMGADLHVYDSGVELGCYGKKTSTEIMSQAPPPGTFFASEDGYIRLGSNPVGAVTVSGAQYGFGLSSNAKSIIADILTRAGFAASMVDASTFVGMGMEEKGIYVKDSSTISAIINKLVFPLGYWYFSATGFLQFGSVQDPSNGTSVYEFRSDTNITSLRFKKPQDTTGGIPAKSITLEYGKNNTVTTSTAGAVSAGRQEWLKTEWRKTSIDADVAHPLSEDITYASVLNYPVSLSTLKAMVCQNRTLAEITVISNEFLPVSLLPPGSCVTLNLLGRFGITGKKMILTSMVKKYADDTITVTLWG